MCSCITTVHVILSLLVWLQLLQASGECRLLWKPLKEECREEVDMAIVILTQ